MVPTLLYVSERDPVPEPDQTNRKRFQSRSSNWPLETLAQIPCPDMLPINGSLLDHLQDPEKLGCLTWEKRLKICLDEDIASPEIRLECLMIGSLETRIMTTRIMRNSWIQVDVYSFGVVMFEILSGLMASERTSFNNEKGYLIKQVHRYYSDEKLDKLIDPNIRDQIDGRSLHTFAETAYRCLSYHVKKRPSMNRIIKMIEEAVSIQEINLATDKFRKKYKNRQWGIWGGHKGKKEFLNELRLISRLHHQNIIPFIDYCDVGGEMILVYKYAINGSLDHHLQD
ncbi:protein kinase-like domain, Phloem protein 2-like protein [Artemisia annua]|uniref:Protein kinase-like domain, Phloem protein 2-like protein n=1 Tax=Artemisia annua TaxID=35608 RepID=A0A2U1Q6S9_ARTAN|nr:protein kinase-like domain, Phloem protein 2-like protein [Artemisia annua]